MASVNAMLTINDDGDAVLHVHEDDYSDDGDDSHSETLPLVRTPQGGGGDDVEAKSEGQDSDGGNDRSGSFHPGMTKAIKLPKKALRLLREATTAPGRVEDIIVYKEQKLKRKPHVVYLKTVRGRRCCRALRWTLTLWPYCCAIVVNAHQYYKLLFLVGIFYALPSAQFVLFQYKQQARTDDMCYFNFKCARPFWVTTILHRDQH